MAPRALALNAVLEDFRRYHGRCGGLGCHRTPPDVPGAFPVLAGLLHPHDVTSASLDARAQGCWRQLVLQLRQNVVDAFEFVRCEAGSERVERQVDYRRVRPARRRRRFD